MVFYSGLEFYLGGVVLWVVVFVVFLFYRNLDKVLIGIVIKFCMKNFC